MKRIILSLIIFLMLLSSSFAYIDENEYVWASSAVNRWKEKGIIAGYTDGTFKGNNNITRADLVIIANRLNNSIERNCKRVAYDVNESDYFFDDVCTAVNKGLIEVDESGNFRPRVYATREEAIIVFSNLFNLSYNGNSYEYLSEKFIDGKNVDVNNVDKIAGFIEAGFISGYSDGTLKPKNNITRAELIVMLDKVITDIYKEGKYLNKSINGSIVINDQNVRIKDSEIRGRIFILDGAKDSLPEIVNTNVGQGIVSRVGQVNIVKEGEFETATEYNEDDVYNEVVLGYIKYDETNWTNDDVKATLRLDDSDYEIINNDGKDYYRFKKNGEFVFECEKDGVIKRFTAEVNNIDNVEPIIKAQITTLSDSANVSISISDDGMSPLDKVAYMKGDVSGKTAVLGTVIENNTFIADEGGKYTIVARDEAGNIGKLVINVDSIYTVKFNSNGGSGNMAFQNFLKDTEGNLKLNEFTNENGNFKGWALSSTGGVVYTDGQSIIPIQNMVLYAVWEINSYEITVIQGENGLISPDTIRVNHGDSQTFTIVPDVNFVVDEVFIDGSSVGAVSTYTFDNVTELHTIRATYKN